MKLIKYLITSLVILIVLIVGGMAVLLLVVDPNEYKPEIVKIANDSTGRDLSIPGEIKLSVFPWIGLKLGETKLSNAAGFKADSFAKLDGIDVKIAFMPLLRGEVSIGVVRLKGLTVNLARDKDGRSNWDDLVAASETQAPSVNSDDAAAAPPAVSLLVGGVEVLDANIYWRDAVEKGSVDLTNFNFKTGQIELGKPIDFKTDFALKNKTPDVQVKATVSATLALDEVFENVNLNKLDFKFEIDESEFLGGKQVVSGQSNIALNLPGQRYSIKDLNLKTDLQGKDLPGGALALVLKTAIDADLEKQTATIKPASLQVLGLEIKTELQAKQILGDVNVEGKLSIDGFSPRELLKSIAMNDALPVTADETVLTAVQVAADFKGGLEAAAISKLNIKLDDTHITGSMAIAELSKTPAYKIKLTLDTIDLDRYLPPALEQTAETANSTEPVLTGDEPIELPTELMRELNADGSFKIGQLKIMNMTVSQLDAGLKANGGVINLNPMNLALYDGTYKGNVQIDVRGQQPLYRISMGLNDVQSEPLLDDFMQESPVVGVMNLSASLKTEGDTVNKIKRALNGKANFSFKDGSLKGFNAAEKMREAKAKLKREEYVPNPNAKHTDFAEFSGGMNIVNGIATFSNTKMSAPALRGFIKKKVNLVTEQLDVRAELYIVDTKTGQDGKALGDVKDFFIPLDVTGPFDDPKIKLDFKAMLKQKNTDKKDEAKAEEKAKLEEKKEEAKEKAKDKLKKKFNKWLKG